MGERGAQGRRAETRGLGYGRARRREVRVSKVVIGAAVMIALGVGTIGYAGWVHLDGLVLADRGVETEVTSATSGYRRGTTVWFRTTDGRQSFCKVAERPTMTRIVYDPEAPDRCRVPEAVGAWSQRELTTGIMGLAVLLGGVVPLVVSVAMNAAKDDLDRLL